MLSISCTSVKFDADIWQVTSAVPVNINGVEFNVGVESRNQSGLGNVKKGPWKVLVSATSLSNASLKIMAAKIITNESGLIVLSKSHSLKMVQLRDDGRWSEWWTVEDSPITINPLFYKEQRLIIDLDISIDNSSTIHIRKIFLPVRLRGREKINIFTM